MIKLSKAKAELAYAEAYLAYKKAAVGSEDLQKKYKVKQSEIERYELDVERAQQNVNDQKEKVDDLTSAATAADTVKSTKTALEDKLFEMNKGDTAALDMQAAKKGNRRSKGEHRKAHEGRRRAGGHGEGRRHDCLRHRHRRRYCERGHRHCDHQPD